MKFLTWMAKILVPLANRMTQCPRYLRCIEKGDKPGGVKGRMNWEKERDDRVIWYCKE